MTAAAPIDTSSEEWKLACLARHVCRMPSRAVRHAFLDLMRKKHDTEFMATLEKTIVDEWSIMHPPKLKAGGANGNA